MSKPTTLKPLSKKILTAIRRVPKGKVASYGEIARRAGNPGAARMVAWLLHSASKKYRLPWHRIICAKGKISFPLFSEDFESQKTRLEREGVEVSMSGAIDLKKFGWKKCR